MEYAEVVDCKVIYIMNDQGGTKTTAPPHKLSPPLLGFLQKTALALGCIRVNMLW